MHQIWPDVHQQVLHASSWLKCQVLLVQPFYVLAYYKPHGQVPVSKMITPHPN